MATLNVINIPDELYEKLQELAAKENRPISAQVVTLLEKALLSESAQNLDNKRQNVAKIIKLIEENSRRREQLSELELPDSTQLLREDRDR